MKYKFFVFCPKDDKVISDVINAAAAAGAGTIGKYTHCAFVIEGYGTWKPLPGANPTVGKIGELSKEEEVLIQMQCPKEKMKAIVKAIQKVHPYEKVAIDAFEFECFE